MKKTRLNTSRHLVTWIPTYNMHYIYYSGSVGCDGRSVGCGVWGEECGLCWKECGT